MAHFGVGAAAGALGAGIGQSISAAVKFGGFAAGALSGAASGASAGFAVGAGNSWLGGASFGEGLKSGLVGAGIGALSGAVFGGVIRGISDYSKGYDFWDGTSFEDYVLSGTDGNVVNKNYDGSLRQSFDEQYLEDRMFDEFGIKEGRIGIKDITTKTGKNYGLMKDGSYLNLESGNKVGGYVMRVSNGYSSVHISPYATYADLTTFRAIAGHEIIHAYHHFTIPNYNSAYSERVAYRYTANTYFNAGNVKTALSTMKTAISLNFWGIAPANYSLPWYVNSFPYIK